MRSFRELLHEAPTLLEALPPEALKSLSATCRSHRTSFCAHVKVIWLSHAEEASKLCCKTWPQLLMVVCSSGPQLASNLSAQWEVLMGMTLSTSASWRHKTAVVIWTRQQVHPLLMDLPKQHSALSDVANRFRHNAEGMMLRGPLISCRAVQSLCHDVWPTVKILHLNQLDANSMSHLTSHLNGSLTSLVGIDIEGCSAAALELLRSGSAWPQVVSLRAPNDQLDASAMSVMPQAKWTHLRFLALSHNVLGASGMQHLVACSWPVLEFLYLANTGIDGTALHHFAAGQWPQLRGLGLTENNIDATGVLCLLQGNWPSLTQLALSERGLDAEACSLLSIAYPARKTVQKVSRKSGLVQLPLLAIEICES